MEERQQKKGFVSSIKRFMRGDGPGIRTVVFLKGCGLRCIWCSSPQTWSVKPEVVFLQKKCIGCGKCQVACPEGAINMEPGAYRIIREKCTDCGACAAVCPPKALRFDGTEMTVGEVLDEALRDAAYYAKTGGGVTLSGGEACVQADFAAELLKECKGRGVHTAVETCGQCPWESMEKVLQYADKVYFDIKHTDSKKHKELTGQGNGLILENLAKAAKLCDVTVNIPVVPGCNDSPENLDQLAELMKGLSLHNIRVLPFHKLGAHEYEEMGLEYPVSDMEKLEPERLEEIKAALEAKGLKVVDN